jgi:hypothetical protein
MNQESSSHLLHIMKSKKTGSAKDLDQFYTNPKIAKMCIDLLKKSVAADSVLHFLEPSAGTGSFSTQLSNCVSVDLDPKIPNVIHSDFLILNKIDLFPNTLSKNICVIGNPPFGKNSSLAVKFFNHSAKIGDTIAFIIPKTFRKQSLQNKLNLNFWLIEDIDLPKDSFIYEGMEFDVPSCFQIWVKREASREVLKFKESDLLEFVSKSNCDFAVRRVGGTAGRAHMDPKDCAEVSHYFLKRKTTQLSVKEIVDLINQIDFSAEANSTAGVRSISKREFVQAFHKKLAY